ncbi:DNA excision repair protein ERCC-8 [Pleurostoma richardsiae]|uniref:DNA excision repair protein ERCC-8 n=1 Tax=Pleurostoma richardsiae TaxID=41990 RepID=A0AA38S4M8_9PEZI|nr:DNA excision repair protein ERCC-8 [Pleurostoma richardsiae]
MNQLLFERATGNIGPNVFAKLETTKLLRSFQPAPQWRFDGGERGSAIGDGESDSPGADRRKDIWAHQSGVNALALERFDGRILISGGSDATIRLWDLEQCGNPNRPHTYRPVAEIAKAETLPGAPAGKSQAHRFGITHLSFYPFDNAAFLSSSYDQTLKLWATDSARLSGSFDIASKIYTHAISPIASHLLVACGTQHPAVRLVDLRSSAAVQSLVAPGQVGAATGAVLSVAWSPRHEHILASGAVDGSVRIWDIRRASGLVGLLDQEDSLGIVHRGADVDSGALRERGIRASAKAHSGPVNGLTWTDDGAYIVSAGHDRRIRVWDAATGANTLASFGPSIRNGQLASATMFTSPVGLTPPRGELLFWPNETEILVLDLHEGTVVTRLRGVGPSMAGVRARRGGERTVKNRVTSIVWRGAGGVGGSSGVVMGGRNALGGIYSAHLDGQIRAWAPHVEGPDNEEDFGEQEDQGERAQKRKAIDDAFRNLMGKKITFT